MDLKRKIEIVTEAVRSISTHSDEDAAVVTAALAKVSSIIDAERARLAAQVDEQIAAKL